MGDARQNPFPGMNPYLESRWQGVHNAVVTYLRDALEDVLPSDLQPQLDDRVFIESVDAPDRFVRPDVYVYESGRGAAPPPATSDGLQLAGAATPVLIELPDAEVRETAIRIIDARSGGRLVTSIEVVSPSNKVPGPGRDLYVQKQQDVRRGGANLVEIDLLRGGRPVTLAIPSAIKPANQAPYHAVAYRAARPTRIEYYPIRLRQKLPAVGVPLRPNDADVVIDLQPLLDRAYAKGRYYNNVIDYALPPDPPLSEADAAWAVARLTEAGALP